MILLDTHVWWWALNETKKLSNKAYKVISDNPPNQRAIASISMWEFAMMVHTEKDGILHRRTYGTLNQWHTG
jgi:PIN domain nuclease of toxin-antitoxin system